MLQNYKIYNQPLSSLPDGNLLINTINAHSYNISRTDAEFRAALQGSDVLLPDGVSIVLALRWLTGERIKKIAGEDLFYWEMKRLQTTDDGQQTSVKKTAMFLGSSEEVLAKIKQRAASDFPSVAVHIYSPPYKSLFSDEDNDAMINAINAVQPDVLFVGMTAPKQEKWAAEHFESLNAGHVCCIGAVFDFYAGTVKRAPKVFINLGLEWFYRLAKEPKRMWRRYLVGNMKFVYSILKEKWSSF